MAAKREKNGGKGIAPKKASDRLSVLRMRRAERRKLRQDRQLGSRTTETIRLIA